MSITGYIDFDKTKAALDFSRVLEFYDIEPVGTGDQIKVRCPFHSPDNNPSCGVNLQKKAFQCFSCKAKGNVLSFVAQMQDLDPEDMQDLKAAAIFAVEEIMGLDPKDFRKAGQAAQRLQNTPDRAEDTEKAGRPASAAKKRSAARTEPQGSTSDQNQAKPDRNKVLDLVLSLDPDHAFFSDRGIAPDQVELFEMGYCSKGMMKGRIAIPIHNADGELVAYAGRWADETTEPGDGQRYKLPKNFHKSLELYNLHRAKELGGRHLTVVEGYWSAQRIHLLGLPCVAAFGSSISEEQAALIRAAGFRFVTLLFDGDEGGRKGIDQALPVLGRQVYARALELPEGEKPDSVEDGFFDALRPSQS